MESDLRYENGSSPARSRTEVFVTVDISAPGHGRTQFSKMDKPIL
jgi:hypothetical protein